MKIMKFFTFDEISSIWIFKSFEIFYFEVQFNFAFFKTKVIVRALTFCSILNAILINAKCKMEILSFSIHDSCNNTIFAIFTAYSSIVCLTFVDRLQLCCKIRNFAVSKFFYISKFDVFDVLNMQFIDISCVRF